MADRPLVSITHLSKSYRPGEQIVEVLRDITLAIPEGDFIALMGPSGSGKSTLLNLIAGIDKPDSGELLVRGEDITRLSESDLADWRASHVGFVFQFYNLMPVLDAFENVELPLLLTSLGKRDRRERVETPHSLLKTSSRQQPRQSVDVHGAAGGDPPLGSPADRAACLARGRRDALGQPPHHEERHLAGVLDSRLLPRAHQGDRRRDGGGDLQ